MEPEKQKQDFKILALSVSVNRSVSMGESTSVFIRRFVNEMCIQRSPYFENFQNKKNNNFCFDFVPQSGPIHTPDHLQIHVF